MLAQHGSRYCRAGNPRGLNSLCLIIKTGRYSHPLTLPLYHTFPKKSNLAGRSNVPRLCCAFRFHAMPLQCRAWLCLCCASRGSDGPSPALASLVLAVRLFALPLQRHALLRLCQAELSYAFAPLGPTVYCLALPVRRLALPLRCGSFQCIAFATFSIVYTKRPLPEFLQHASPRNSP